MSDLGSMLDAMSLPEPGYDADWTTQARDEAGRWDGKMIDPFDRPVKWVVES